MKQKLLFTFLITICLGLFAQVESTIPNVDYENTQDLIIGQKSAGIMVGKTYYDALMAYEDS